MTGPPPTQDAKGAPVVPQAPPNGPTAADGRRSAQFRRSRQSRHTPPGPAGGVGLSRAGTTPTRDDGHLDPRPPVARDDMTIQDGDTGQNSGRRTPAETTVPDLSRSSLWVVTTTGMTVGVFASMTSAGLAGLSWCSEPKAAVSSRRMREAGAAGNSVGVHTDARAFRTHRRAVGRRRYGRSHGAADLG